jgi:biotin carboxylase
MTTRTYRAKAFLAAARRLGIGVVVGSEHKAALAARARDTTLALDIRHHERAVHQIAAYARTYPLDAIVGVDDDTTLLAGEAAHELGLPHNAPEAIRVSRDKFASRRRLADAGLPSPAYLLLMPDDDVDAVVGSVPYPCVLKPVALSASRGVIRANDAAELRAAWERIVAMLRADRAERLDVLVESFVPGPEVALEGMLIDGRLSTLALFDKPDPLDGPYFEETIYVTPSRLPLADQQAIMRTTAQGAEAFGLRSGPVHAELRLGNRRGPVIVEIAARSIGGLCSSTLRFGTGYSLEELILRHATGAPLGSLEREQSASGVMMLPIPAAGILRGVRGRAQALRVPGIEELVMSIPIGQPVVPLPEGDRYLGFLFARAETPDAVEAALRTAHSHLGFMIGPEELKGASSCYMVVPAERMLPVLSSH